jgi:hypothetical protein
VTGRRGHATLTRRILVVACMLVGGIAGAELVLNVGTIVPTLSTSSAPATPPASMLATTRIRRVSVAWPRRPDCRSWPMPVSVMVSTVVVRSGTARARATEFWMPIAMARMAARA